MLFFHPNGIIKHQLNVDTHPPGCENKKLDSVTCQEGPIFGVGVKFGWIWPLTSLLIYLLNKIPSNECGRETKVLEAFTLYDEGIFLRLCCKGRQMKHGQYILLNCPTIATLEWHPFSVIETNDDSFTVTISVRGDWTRRLYKSVSYDQNLKLDVEGPIPSAMEAMLRFKRIVCLAAGIGITPIISNLHHLLKNENLIVPKRIHLIWICRSFDTFSWFSEAITQLNEKFFEQNKPDRLMVKLFCTKDYNSNLVEEYFGDNYFIKSRIYPGRPNWNDEFREILQFYNR